MCAQGSACQCNVFHIIICKLGDSVHWQGRDIKARKGEVRVGGTELEEVQGAANIINYVTLQMILRTKVMTCSQHANSTCLVCPKTHFIIICIFNCWSNQYWHTIFCFSVFSTLTLCFSQVWSMTCLVGKLTQINMLK